ncbi:unnamed protein product [Trichogramma brassicae]|uniref:Uncharacterized protein n=1 Tax=Trichogramma brassicae TaxID=86971 RepID=A0A6H5I7J8_9HYME|nr:unnamed protein product [Trichogramma brassicae]
MTSIFFGSISTPRSLTICPRNPNFLSEEMDLFSGSRISLAPRRRVKESPYFGIVFLQILGVHYDIVKSKSFLRD